MTQLEIDQRLSMIYPGITPGTKIAHNGVQYTYKGTDIIISQISFLRREFPMYVDTAAATQMLVDPLAYRPPTFQLDPSLTAALRGDTQAAMRGSFGVAMSRAVTAGALANLSNGSVLGAAIGGGLGGGIAGAAAGAVLGNALKGSGPLGSALGGVLGGALGSQLSSLASNFIPPGLDGPIQAIGGLVSGSLLSALPFKTSGAASIATQGLTKIVAVKALLNTTIKGPGSLIFAAIGSNLLADVVSKAAAGAGINLQSEMASLAGLAANPIAFAAKAAGIQAAFPMLNVNAMAANMLAGAALGALGGKGFNLNSMIPNMVAGAVASLLPIPGKTPVMDAMRPRETPPPPTPRQPAQMRNLFAEGAAAASMSTLNRPLSSFMGLMSTVAPAAMLVADSATKTSLGNQKLIGNANTANWGSGGYGRNTAQEAREKKRLELSSQIETKTQDLLSSVDYSKLKKYSYADLIKKYPRIKPTSTVIEALAIIEEDDEAAAAKAAANANTATMTV